MAARLVAIPISIPISVSIPVAMTAALLRRWLRRTLTLEVFRWTLEPAHLLAQRFDVALVGGLLPLGFLQQLEHFIHLLERLAQSRDHLHDVIDALANGFLLGRAEIAGRRRWRRLATLMAFFARWRRWGRFAHFCRRSGRWWFSWFHIGPGRKEGFFSTGNLTDLLDFGRVRGRDCFR